MPGPVRNNETDYSKHVCYQEPDASESKANQSSARPEPTNASGLGPRREYVTEARSSELSESSRKLAQRASKPPAAVVAARAKLETKVTLSSVEVKLTAPSGDASISKKFSLPIKIEPRDLDGDGNKEICVEAFGAEHCVPTDPPPPVEGAHGASGDDRSTGTGGSSGS